MESGAQRSLSLQRRLIILLLLVGLVPLLLVAMLNNLQSADTIASLANSQLAQLAISSSEILEKDVFDRSSNVQTFANSDGARSLDPLRITPLMTRMTLIYQPYYKLMLVANADGEIIAASSARPDGTFLDGAQFVGNRVRGEEWFEIWHDRRIKSGTTFVDDIRIDLRVEQLYGQQSYVLTFSHGIFNQAGTLIGVWVSYVDWQLMESLLRETVQRPHAGGAGTTMLTLLNRDNVILASSDGSIPLQRTYTPPAESLVQRAIVESGAHRPLGWSVVATQSRSEALSTARRQTLQTLLAALGLGILVVIVGIMVTRAITKPLEALEEGAVAVSQGNLNIHVPEGPGEVGRVAQAFNLMTNELRTLYVNLEEQVTQRTAELESTLVHLKQRSVELQLSQQQLSAINANLSHSEARYRSLFERTQEMLNETQVLYRVSRALIDAAELQMILNHAVDGAVEALDASAVILVLIDHDAQLVTEFVCGGPDCKGLDPVPYSQVIDGLSGWVLTHEKPALSPAGAPDPRETPRTAEWRYTRSIGAMIVAPLLYQGHVLGTLSACHRSADLQFSPYDVELLVTIASQVAVVIQNTYLYASAQQELAERRRIEEELRSYQEHLEEQVQQRTAELADIAAELRVTNVRLQADVTLARDIQLGLLPMRPPWDLRSLDVAARSLAAAEVGGDFYTYLPTQHSGGVVVVGDISGKGVGAALLMALLMSALENEADVFADPALTANRLNQTLMQRFRSNRMNAALCLVEFDLQQCKLTFVNAGMIGPFILRSGSIELLEVGAFPIGMVPLPYHATHFPLQPEDVIVLVSDGVVEAHNPQGEMYGFERLELCLCAAPVDSPLAELVDHIFQDVLDFMAKTPQHDDMTIVAVRPLIFQTLLPNTPSDMVES